LTEVIVFRIGFGEIYCILLLFAADHTYRERPMFRWLLTIFLALVIFSSLLPWLEKLGVGRLPGDLRFSIFGKTFFLPFASTVLLSLVIFLIARFI
jgi:hypothetical protein